MLNLWPNGPGNKIRIFFSNKLKFIVWLSGLSLLYIFIAVIIQCVIVERYIFYIWKYAMKMMRKTRKKIDFKILILKKEKKMIYEFGNYYYEQLALLTIDNYRIDKGRQIKCLINENDRMPTDFIFDIACGVRRTSIKIR